MTGFAQEYFLQILNLISIVGKFKTPLSKYDTTTREPWIYWIMWAKFSTEVNQNLIRLQM